MTCGYGTSPSSLPTIMMAGFRQTAADIDFSSIDSAELGSGDLADVLSELTDIGDKVGKLETVLLGTTGCVDPLKTENIVKKWLEQDYDTPPLLAKRNGDEEEDSTLPSYRRLAKAVASKIFGNTKLAKTIAKNHPLQAKQPYHVKPVQVRSQLKYPADSTLDYIEPDSGMSSTDKQILEPIRAFRATSVGSIGSRVTSKPTEETGDFVSKSVSDPVPCDSDDEALHYSMRLSSNRHSKVMQLRCRLQKAQGENSILYDQLVHARASLKSAQEEKQQLVENKQRLESENKELKEDNKCLKDENYSLQKLILNQQFNNVNDVNSN